MKKLFFLLICLFPLFMRAEEYTLEIRGGVFFPSNGQTRTVFSDAWLDYQTLVSMSLNDYFDLFTQVSWSIKKGTINDRYFGRSFEDHTRAWIVPVSLGARAYLPLCRFLTLYGGAGVTYSFLKLESYPKESFAGSNFKKNLSYRTVGGLAKVGLIIDVGSDVFIDLFADYLYQNFTIDRRRCFKDFGSHFDASGFKCGAGLGLYF